MNNKKLTIRNSTAEFLIFTSQANEDGIEELLERVYALLTAMGYDVWMSHKGTMPVVPDKTAFENCLTAVEKGLIFLKISGLLKCMKQQ
jgi:putative SOS response-associated peptidase YedK